MAPDRRQFIDGKEVVKSRPSGLTGESEYELEDGSVWRTYGPSGTIRNVDANCTGFRIRPVITV